MKARTQTLISRLAAGVLLCAAAFTFTACENFLSGDDIKEQIETEIAYNNAKDVTIQIDGAGQGLITPSGAVTRKVGYDFEIQFKPDTDNFFIQSIESIFQVVSLYDEDKEYNGNIEFTTLEQTDDDKQNGIYRIKAKIKKNVSGMLIKPNCIEVPKIVEVFPPNNLIDYRQDISVEITFNKSVKLEDFVYENGTLKNIQMLSYGNNLLDNSNGKIPFYSDAYLKDEGKKLVIPVTIGNSLLSQGATISYKDIDVEINLKNLMDAEGVPFKTEGYSFSYRVNSNKDSTPPVINKLQIAKTETDARNGTNLITLDDFIYYADKANYESDSKIVAANIENHHVNNVWVYIEADDADSGVEGLEIKEQLIRLPTTTGANLTSQVIYDKDTNPKSNMFYNQTKQKTFSSCFNYKFNEIQDGVIHLEFIAADRAGKTTSQTAELIKDTVCTVDMEINDYDRTKHIKENKEGNAHLYTYSVPLFSYKNEYQYYCTDMNSVRYKDTFHGIGSYKSTNPAAEVDFSGVNLDVVDFKWGYDEEHMQTADLQYKDDTQYVYWTSYDYSAGWTNKKLFPKITVDPTRTIYAKWTVKDSVGNSKTFTDSIPGNISIISGKYDSGWKFNYNKVVLPNEYTQFFYVVEKSIDDETIISTNTYRGTEISSALKNPSTWSDCIKEIYYCHTNNPVSGYSSFWVVLGDPFVVRKKNGVVTYGKENPITIDNSAIPTTSQFNLTSDTPVLNKGTHNIKLNFSNFSPVSGANYYLDCYCKTSGEKNIETEIIFSITNFTTETQFTIPSKAQMYYFKILADNGSSLRKESGEKSLDLSYDNIPPDLSDIHKLNQSSIKPGAIIIKKLDTLIKDDSAIKSEIKYFFSDSDGLKWENIPMKTGHINNNQVTFIADDGFKPYLYIAVEDINGNSAKRVINPPIGYWACETPTYVAASTSSVKMTTKKWILYPPTSYRIYVTYEYLDNDVWIEKNITFDYYNDPNSFTTSDNSFVRWNLGYHKDGSSGLTNFTYSDVYYFYPPAYFTGSSVVCNIKDYIIGNRGITIFVDKPCLVHTLYSSINWEEELQTWLNMGIEAKIQSKNTTFTYEEPGNIPAGKYYTTIIHYADGTVEMTPVKQK